ncbi:MAG: hypothetical protein U0470_07725 [Anaerolineae bacterium]
MIVMLTDGLPNRVPISPVTGNQGTVIDAAQKAKDAGMKVYTIGFGRRTRPLIDRVLPSLLEVCASQPSMSFVEPRGDRIRASTPRSRHLRATAATIGRSRGRGGQGR